MKLGTFPLKAWQYGFSLIELLIVVSIIAMLAGFVAPKYFSRIAILNDKWPERRSTTWIKQ